MTENVIARPSYDPMVPNWKSRILTGHLQYMPNHFLGYQLCTPENLDVVQVTNFTGENNRRLSTIIWPHGIKWNFQNFIAHLQDIPNHRVSFVYSMKCWQSCSDNNFNNCKIIIFWALIKPWGKNEKKNQDFITHLQDMPNQVLDYNLAMT